MQPNQIKFDLNMDWLYDLMRNQTRRNYLEKLSEPSNVVLMSVSRFSMVDTHLGCWILVNFDSYDADQATTDLVHMLSRHFHEKCSIGLVDITYPANWELLSPIVSQNTPSILLKRRFVYDMFSFCMLIVKKVPQKWSVSSSSQKTGVQW